MSIYWRLANFDRMLRSQKMRNCLNIPGMLKLFFGKSCFSISNLIFDFECSSYILAHSSGVVLRLWVVRPYSSTTFDSRI